MEFKEKYVSLKKNYISTDAATEIKFYPSVEDSLKNIAEEEGYISYNIYKQMISTTGNNYMGELYEVTIEGETKCGTKKINIFLKHIISTEALKPFMNVTQCYLNEVFFYTELKDIFNDLQKVANIPEEDRFIMVKSYNGSNTDAILLENLNKKGFKTLHRMNIMSLKFAELSLKQLAKLHGLSYVLKLKRKDYSDKKIKTLKYSLDLKHIWKALLKRQINSTMLYFDSEVQNKLERFRHTMYEKYPKYMVNEISFFNCLCHGDFKSNNVMIKENDEGESEAILIDYQLLFYGAPILDILYFIFTGSDRDFRRAHMNDLKNLYHDTLTEFLKYFDVDINNVYPKNVFDKHFEETLDYGLMVALYNLPFNFTADDSILDFNNIDMDIVTVKVNDKYRQRLTEIVEECLDWGILK